MRNRILRFATCLIILFSALATYAQGPDEAPVRSPEEILGDGSVLPTPDAIRELFVNCSSWDEKHEAVSESSKQALIDLGETAVPTLLEYLPFENVLKRVTLDDIIHGIGSPAAQYLLPHLKSESAYTRRHAGYLIGDVAGAGELEDPYRLGPVTNDMPSIAALTAALNVETDWHVSASIIESLGKMRDPSQINLIAIYLKNDEEGIRLAAVRGLGSIPAQDAVVELISAYGDTLASVRQAAVTALSTSTMGNLAFESLIGSMGLSPAGLTGQQCAMESLRIYLEATATDDSQRTADQRKRTYDQCVAVLSTAGVESVWTLAGYAFELIGYTYQPDAVLFLESKQKSDIHPFVKGKIVEAMERLEAGKPVAVEE